MSTVPWSTASCFVVAMWVCSTTGPPASARSCRRCDRSRSGIDVRRDLGDADDVAPPPPSSGRSVQSMSVCLPRAWIQSGDRVVEPRGPVVPGCARSIGVQRARLRSRAIPRPSEDAYISRRPAPLARAGAGPTQAITGTLQLDHPLRQRHAVLDRAFRRCRSAGRRPRPPPRRRRDGRSDSRAAAGRSRLPP